MKRSLFLPLAITAAGACVHTNVATLDPTVSHPPICTAGVQLFTAAGRVTAPYTEVALLNSRGSSGATDERQMFESMRQKAAQTGANGVILANIAEASAGAKVAGAFLGTGTERKGRAIAIHLPSDSARVRSACTRTFTDAAGTTWTVSEIQEALPSLRFESDGRTLYLTPDGLRPTWRDLDAKGMARLLKQARPRKGSG